MSLSFPLPSGAYSLATQLRFGFPGEFSFQGNRSFWESNPGKGSGARKGQCSD